MGGSGVRDEEQRKQDGMDAPESQAGASEAGAEAPVEEAGEDWQALAEERWDSLLRLRADFENFRRRTDREREEFRSLVASEIFSRFLLVYDNLDRALKAIPDTQDVAAWRTGIEMTRRGFLELLKREGMETIPSVGEPFNPEVHEAIVRVPDEAPEGTVLEELQAGFKSGARVIRAALVKVSAGPEERSEPGDGGDMTEQGGDGGGPA
jgi:molecular chaperone GrpE